MFKVISIAVLIYTLIKLILPKKKLKPGVNNDKNTPPETVDVDYEEVD